MHVLIIPSWYFPYGTHEIGGRMIHHFASGMREEGIDARILFADFSLSAPFLKQTNYSIEEGVPTWRTRQWFVPKFNSAMIYFWISKYVRAIQEYILKAGKPDILHAQSYMAGLVCEEVHRKTNIPFVFTERASSFITGKIPNRHSSFIRNSFDAATIITAVSPGLKSRLEQFIKKHIEVIPNFYDPTIFYPDPNIPKYKKFTWVSIGEPARVKGLDLLIQAFAKIKHRLTDIDMQLILIDRIPEQQELMILSQSLNVQNDIVWKGLISQVEVAGILRQSHVLVSASRVETFGKTILEAQACGLPVVVTTTDGATYLMTSEDQGLMATINNVDSLYDAMSDMYWKYSSYDPQLIISHVESRFKKEIVLQQWKKLYNNIAR